MVEPILQHIKDNISFSDEYMSDIYRTGLVNVYDICYNYNRNHSNNIIPDNKSGHLDNQYNKNNEMDICEVNSNNNYDEDKIIRAMLSNNKISILYDTICPKGGDKNKKDENENISFVLNELIHFPSSVDDSLSINNKLFNIDNNTIKSLNVNSSTSENTTIQKKEIDDMSIEIDDNNNDNNEIKTIYKLFDFLKEESLDKIRLQYDEIYETIYNKAKPFVDEIVDNKEILEEIIDTYISTMVLYMITLDKLGFKADGMIEKIKALYFINDKDEDITKVKKDYNNYDYINKLISQRCEEQQDMSKDKLYNKFSQVKKRGRRNKVKPEDILNPIETVTTGYITSEKASGNNNLKSNLLKLEKNNISLLSSSSSSSSSTIESKIELSNNEEVIIDDRSLVATTITNNDKKSNPFDLYPIFSKTLGIMNKLIPKSINHGYFLENTINCIRNLDPTLWHAQKFIEKLNNMEYIYYEKKKIYFDESKKRYYCCMSGLPISNGEEVNWYRIVELNVDRFKQSNKLPDGTPFENDNFKQSITSFFSKTKLTSLHNIFCTPFSDEYKSSFTGVDSNNKISIKPTIVNIPTIKKESKFSTINTLYSKPIEIKTELKQESSQKAEPLINTSFNNNNNNNNNKSKRGPKPKNIKLMDKEDKKTIKSTKNKDNSQLTINKVTRKRNASKLEETSSKLPKSKINVKKPRNNNDSIKKEPNIYKGLTEVKIEPKNDDNGDNQLGYNPIKRINNNNILFEQKMMKDGIIMKRGISSNIMWKKMINIYRTIEKGDLDEFLWFNIHERQYVKNYKQEHENLYLVFNNMTDNNFKQQMERLLFYYIKTSIPSSSDLKIEDITIETQKDRLNRFFDIILDFIDVLFKINENIINNNEFKKERMESSEYIIDLKFKYDNENVLLRNLFLCSDDRRIIHKKKDSDNIFFKMIKENNFNSVLSIEYFMTYIFFFVILFSYIFENKKSDKLISNNLDKEYSYPSEIKFLKELRITFNTF